MPHVHPDLDSFTRLAETPVAAGETLVLPLYRRLFSDALTPVLAYRRLVRPDPRMAPSFLLESVVGGERVARYSFLGAQPVAEVTARRDEVVYTDHRDASNSRSYRCSDPLAEMARLTGGLRFVNMAELPDFTGGWVGCVGYDAVRYLEPEKLSQGPADDRGLPDMHMQLYHDVIAFDHAQKSVLVITHIRMDEHATAEAARAAGERRLGELVDRLVTPVPPRQAELHVGDVDLKSAPPKLPTSTMGDGGYQRAVEACKRYIAAGDCFQIVPSQRFEVATVADPFDIYRALRVVNPSPYMFYVQIDGAILVGSSPEILCRVQDRKVWNRPLAGTRRRGADPAEDRALEAELRSDPKDIAEHVMLVDLGRNDVGRVATPGTIELPGVLQVERYSHVMHLSSTVTGELRPELSCWDALRVTLPVGTVSGAPKVRAMQIIDELEPTRRGPYAGAVGYVDFSGNMDMALALRTMVAMPAAEGGRGGWRVHLQAGAGIVADSDPDLEHQETVNKAAALAKAIAVAEQSFTPR
jgi:anthranilate synthase component 1